MEAEFRHLPGVIATSVGYAGGHTDHPTYEAVCGHGTGHAEAVMVEYDPAAVSYEQLLDCFWSLHNPTAVRSPGSQYRSVIFTFTPEQRETALASRDRLAREGRFARPITTEIEPAGAYWPAEEYHQQFEEKRGAVRCAR